MKFRRGLLARKAGRHADARREFGAAAELARRCGSKQLLVPSLKGVAQIERDTGNAAAAVPLYEEAVANCRAIGDRALLAHTLRHLGDVHQDLEQLAPAETCYREALALYRESGSAKPLDLANALRPYALLKERTGRNTEARELWAEAHRLYASVNAEAGVAESASHMQRLDESSSVR
ncbi:MAG TPA: tetratricopeptide repeat protein [Gammaproteobacteria bacterium]